MLNTPLEEIVDIILKHRHFIISSHIHLDGDALGSQLALYSVLSEQLKKNVTIINQDHVPEIYRFLPGAQDILCSESSLNHKSFDIQSDTILISLDASNLDRLGNIQIDYTKIKYIINIDHHPSNDKFGHYNYIDTNASSVGEIIFHFIQKMNCIITHSIAVNLYTAIITDTGSFRYANTTINTFKVAIELLKTNIKPNEIVDKIYNSNKTSSLKLLGEALRNINIDPSKKISWTIISRKLLSDLGAKDEETEGIVDKILSIKDIQVSALFRETKDGYVKVSFRSKGNFDVDAFSRKFGGGGHSNAAGCQFKGDLSEIVGKIILQLQKEIIFC